MPQFDQTKTTGLPIRGLIYGAAKRKKTWWAANAAVFGFNVIFIEGDDGTSIISQVSAEARQRVYIVDGRDEADDPKYSYLCTKIFKGSDFLWDEQEKLDQLIRKTADKSHTFVEFRKDKLTLNDILVFDSWTAFVRSLIRRYMVDNSIDISTKTKLDKKWHETHYNWTGAMADWALEQLKTFPCNVLVIAHEQSYEKRDKDDDTKIVLSKMQPISTSNNQAMRLSKYFSDILYFEAVGDAVWIDPRMSADRDGGCRNVLPKKDRWENIQFDKLAAGAGIVSTGAALEGFRFYGAGELPVEVTKTGVAISVGSPSLTGIVTPTQPGQATPISLTSLMKGTNA